MALEEEENALRLGVEISEPEYPQSPMPVPHTEEAVAEVDEASSSEHPSPLPSEDQRELTDLKTNEA